MNYSQLDLKVGPKIQRPKPSTVNLGSPHFQVGPRRRLVEPADKGRKAIRPGTIKEFREDSVVWGILGLGAVQWA